MNLIEKAYRLLYPDSDFPYTPRLIYSGRFSNYNANVRLFRGILEFRLCRKWKDVSEEIQIGLIQELMMKLWKRKKVSSTTYVDLYNGFVKRLHMTIPKTKTHPVLEESFERVNEKYFYGAVEQPNLAWGTYSKRKLGSYDYKSDTITISKVFTKMDPIYLDLVMYHEMLHKHHSYSNKNGRNRFHDSGFRKKEKAFENHDKLDRQLSVELTKVRIKNFFGFR
jgi:hypothetical protein